MQSMGAAVPGEGRPFQSQRQTFNGLAEMVEIQVGYSKLPAASADAITLGSSKCLFSLIPIAADEQHTLNFRDLRDEYRGGSHVSIPAIDAEMKGFAVAVIRASRFAKIAFKYENAQSL
jgi:hypothetical protein